MKKTGNIEDRIQPDLYRKIEAAANEYREPYHLTVSVIIPHYNSVPLLQRCVAALAEQTYPLEMIEVVIADDGSDQVPRLSDFDHAKRLNIKIFSQPRQGPRRNAARNLAIENAAGEILICLDADIIPVENLIESHMRLFHICRDIATIGPRKFIETDIKPSEMPEKLAGLKDYPDVRSESNRGFAVDNRLPFFKDFQNEQNPYWFFYSCNVGFNRAAALRVGGFDRHFDGHWGYGDIEVGYRLFLDGNIFMYVSDALALHQEDTQLTWRERLDDGEISLLKLIEKWPELDDQEPDTLPKIDE